MGQALADSAPDCVEAIAFRMGVPRQHGRYLMAHNLGQIGIVDARSAQMRDVAVAALVGADV